MHLLWLGDLDQLKTEMKREKKAHQERLKKLKKLTELGGEEVSKELRKARKEIKKEKKALKRMREREERLNRRSRTPEEERGHADDEGRWDVKKKKLDDFELDVCCYLTFDRVVRVLRLCRL